jgi:oligopeptide/dipeptide ABC transporter ATP-binding protein
MMDSTEFSTTVATNGSRLTVPLLTLSDVVQEFRVRVRGSIHLGIVSAVAGVSSDVERGETFAVVGETGSGKSTLARTVLRAPKAQSGSIVLEGHELGASARSIPREVSRLTQMVFQDPFSALNPKWTVERIVTEPLAIAGEGRTNARRRRIAEILELVGLAPTTFASKLPYELSGGQAQRVAIARALVSSPKLVICDEPVTALDVSIQAQILNLLDDLKHELSLTYLLIAHDLAVVRVLADRIGTMYLGKLCEVSDSESLFENPAHPYTAALLSAIPPRPGEPMTRERIRLRGEPPSPLAPPSGCRFRTRCAYATDICAAVEPQMREIRLGQKVACHFPLTAA